MNLSPTWVDYLARAGFSAVHWSQVGPRDAPDSEVMAWAADHDHVVLTADLDFGAILAATRSNKPSVLLLRSELPTPNVIGRTVLAAIRQARGDLVEGAILSVDVSRSRSRILPLRG